MGRAGQWLEATTILQCACLPGLRASRGTALKMLQIARVKIEWPRLESGHRPLFNLVPRDERLRTFSTEGMGRLTCGPGPDFH